MELTTCARPYAKAAFEYARQAGALAQWSDMLQQASTVYQDEKMAGVLLSPSLTAEKQAELFIQVCGESLDSNGQNFVQTLADNKRITLLPQIAALFELLKAEQESTADVEVSSAFPLTQAQLDVMAEKLRKRLDREVKMHSSVDPSLIGGVVIKAGDLVIDGSVRARLAKLADTMNS